MTNARYRAGQKCCAALALATVGLFSAAARGGGAEFPGGTMAANGKTCTGNFEYDTQNNLAATVISQQCAVMMGLGTLNASTGVFTPNNDPATGKAPTMNQANNGAYNFYGYQNVKITVNGSDGKPCSFNQSIYVATNQSGGNAALAGDNTLNTAWINAMKGAIFGAGSSAKAYWPVAPPAPPKAAPAKKLIDTNLDSSSRETFQFNLSNGGTTVTTNMVYGSDSDFTVIPQSVATALGLTTTGTINLSTSDPSELAALTLDDFDNDGETTYLEATLPLIADAGGLAPGQTGLTVLVADNADSEFGILGSDVASEYAYVSQVDLSNPDGSGEDEFLAAASAVPEPASMTMLAFGGLGLLARRRKIRTGG